MHRFAPSLMLLSALALTGCGPSQGGGATAAAPPVTPGEQALSSVPLGQPPGETVSPASALANPYEGDATAVAEGKALFASMNCVYCHGAAGSALIGPALNAHGWRYGGAPAQLYNSIHDGRPQGMPAWGMRLPPDQIWKLVAYLESLGGASPPATAKMAAIGGDTPSSTGPQVNGQAATDAAHAALVAGDASNEAR